MTLSNYFTALNLFLPLKNDFLQDSLCQFNKLLLFPRHSKQGSKQPANHDQPFRVMRTLLKLRRVSCPPWPLRQSWSSSFSSLRSRTSFLHLKASHFSLAMKPHPGHSIPRYLSPTLVTGSLPARELYFLCIIFLSWVLPLVKQINHLLTPAQLIHSDLWTFVITLALSRKSSCSPWGLACAFSQRS